jgi:hypothetical protein
MKKMIFSLSLGSLIGIAAIIAIANVNLGSKSSSESWITLKNVEGLSQEIPGHSSGVWVSSGTTEEEMVYLGGECFCKKQSSQTFSCSPTGTAAYICGTYREVVDYIPVDC